MSSVGTKARYERVLLREVQAHEWQWRPETVYFGGGTPSLMPLTLLRDLMSAIPAGNLTEVTLECAPGTISEGAAHCWKECGVNRVSLGVQSFVTAELRQVGRRHSAATVEQDIAVLRQAGISNLNIDLIAGLPGQTVASWDYSFACLERLAPPHVSVYIFEVDEESRLGKEVLIGGHRYGAPNLPGDDVTAELYEIAVERLAHRGLVRYEISNFARAGWESRHNLKYWQLEPYIGFGLDAHSFDRTRRWSNSGTLDSYLGGLWGRSPDPHRTPPADPSEEHFFIGLRLMKGIEPTAEEWNRFAGPINKWMQAGMLEREATRLRLADRGVLLSNEIFQEFIA